MDKAIHLAQSVDLNKISYLLLNEVEAENYTGSKNPQDCLQYFRENFPDLTVVLTLGGQGCLYMNGDTELTQEAFRVDVVDTTAAGDTFTGYFVAGLAEHMEPVDILRRASVAAGLSVSKKGAAPSIPYKQEVQSMVKSFV